MDTFLNILNAEATQKVVDGIGKAISSLGDGAVYVASIFVKQQLVIGIQDLIWATVLIVAGVMGIRFLINEERKELRGDDNLMSVATTEGFSILLWIVMSLCLFFSLFPLNDGIGRLINPQYYAIQDGFKMVTGKDLNSVNND